MSRKIGAIKTFASLWQSHEKLYCSIFKKALNQLTLPTEQQKDEDAISEALCPILRKTCFEHESDIRTPDWEKPIQPSIQEDLNGGKKRKRPDFTCNLINAMATSENMYEIPFHIECKRLGKQCGSWNLNKNYVTYGIVRFDSSEHQYGKLAPSGMMIGYIVSMEQLAIVSEVNKWLKDFFPEIAFSRKTTACEQRLSRKNVEPKLFKLIHLWADLK